MLIDSDEHLEAIEKLLAEGSSASLTYAALECRLAIEAICYECLRNAHDYISQEDLRRWQPRDVINQLKQDVDENVDSTFTLSVADGAPHEESSEGYKQLEWVELGTQVGFDPNYLGRLWNALSSIALHVRIPENKNDFLERYGDKSKLHAKVVEALHEIRRISSGNLVLSGLGEEIRFECLCGAQNRRRAKLLRSGTIITCINPVCDESYHCKIQDGEFQFRRRLVTLTCECPDGMKIPKRIVEKVKVSDSIVVTCDVCQTKVAIAWRLMQTKAS